MSKKSRVVWLILFTLAISLISINVLAEETSKELSIIAAPETGTAPLTVDFSLNQAADTYSWDFTSDGIVDSTEAAPQQTYPEEGDYSVTVNVSLAEQSYLVHKTVQVKKPISISAVANPSSGKAPLTVQFTAIANGKEPQSYSWDFNNDSKIDSTQQNPTYTFAKPGDYEIKLKVIDAEKNTAAASLLLAVTKYDSHLNLTSYFPKTISLGENQITFLVANMGEEIVNEVGAKIIGEGVQYLTSTSIPVLNPGDQDSLTVKINILQAGELSATAKILEKSFPLSFTITEQVVYNKEELQLKLNQLKEQLKQEESIYYEKKAQGYQVNEVSDSIKSLQALIQTTQQQILTGKLADAQVGSDLTAAAITDLSSDLGKVQKPKVTVMMWLKENSLAITATVAALGTLSGIIVKLTFHVSKAKDQVKEHAQKLSGDVRKKFSLRRKEEESEEIKDKATDNPEPIKTEDSKLTESKTEPSNDQKEKL
ncbi:MAG: PKD domain-containing protein [Nanoarchaeota archaeon]